MDTGIPRGLPSTNYWPTLTQWFVQHAQWLHCCTEVPLQATFSKLKIVGVAWGGGYLPRSGPLLYFTIVAIKYNIQYQDGSHEGSSVGRGENTKARKEQ